MKAAVPITCWETRKNWHLTHQRKKSTKKSPFRPLRKRSPKLRDGPRGAVTDSEHAFRRPFWTAAGLRPASSWIQNSQGFFERGSHQAEPWAYW